MVLYIRRSTDRQELSMGSQRSRLLEWFNSDEWEIYEIIEDDAMSGGLDDRPGFQRINAMATSKNPPFDAVGVYDMSRLSRDLETRVRTQRQFAMNGVQIISITQTFEEGPSGDLHRNVVAVFDDHQLKQLSSLSRRGLEDVVKAGGYTGAKAPFGYRKIREVLRDGKEHPTLEINPEEAEIFIKYIKEPALLGKTPLSITIALNEAGIPSPTGRPWGKTVITRMLRNIVYTGTGMLGERQRSRYRPKTDPIYVPGSYPALTEMEEYRTIQELLNSRRWTKKAARSVASDFVFSGKVRCGYCNRAMKINSKGKRGRPKLRCSKKDDQGAKSCPSTDVDREDFQNAVMARLCAHTLSGDNLRERLGEIADGVSVYVEDAKLKLKPIRERKSEIKKERDNIRRQMNEEAEQGRTVPRMGVWLNELDEEEARLDQTARGIDDRMEGLDRFLKDERRIIDSAKERATYLQSKDPDIAKRFVESFIKEIAVKDQVATIYYTIPMPLSGGVEKTYVEELNVADAVWPIDTPSSGGVPFTTAKVASESLTSLRSACPTM
ncbi:MAG: hypothetical protein F4X66_12795 [Chloroflexi bacterium]|nr:hypothetical protein [Chloroflexota bacterium]